MNLAPTPDEIRRNDEERRRIYEEQEKSMMPEQVVAKAHKELDDKLCEALAVSEALAIELIGLIAENESKIEDLEAANEANQALAESLAEQLEEAKNELLEIEQKGFNG